MSTSAKKSLPAFSGAMAPLRQALAGLQLRERRAVTLAAWVVGLGLVWWLAIAPALTTLRQAPQRHAGLDTQLSQMRGMAATAQALRSQTTAQPPARDDALRALELATSALGGTAQLTVQGERATLTLNNTTPEALAQWLAQVRINARLVPVEAKLTRPGNPPGWTGTMVVSGPGLAARP